MRDEVAGWPAWVWGVLAWLVWAVLLEERVPRLSPEDVRRVEEVLAREARTPDPAEMSARRWRSIPGVGVRRALDLVRAAEEGRLGPGGTAWTRVDGIGEATARRIDAWLLAHGQGGRELGQARAEEVAGEAGRAAESRSPPPGPGLVGPPPRP